MAMIAIGDVTSLMRRLFAASSRPIRLIVGAGLVLVVIIQIGGGIVIYNSRQAVIAAKARELNNLTLVIADQLNRVIDAVTAVRLNLTAQFQAHDFSANEEFERQQSDQATHWKLKTYAYNLPQIGSIALIAIDGKLFNSSRSWPPREENVSNSDYFRALRANPEITSAMGHPVRSRANNAWVIHVAHKVLGRNGEMIGIVAVTIELQYISKLFERISLGPDTSIASFFMDGTLLARHPNIESGIGRIATRNMPFIKLLSHSNRGSARITGVFDSKDRIVSAHRVADYPLAVTATATTDSALADWRLMMVLTAAMVVVVTLTVLGMVLLFIRQIRHHDIASRWRAKEHEDMPARQNMEQMNVVLEHLSQGLSMFDAEQRLVMCNQRYSEIYRFTPEQVKPGTTLGQIAEYHIAGGTFAGTDPDAYRAEMQADAVNRIADAWSLGTKFASGTQASNEKWRRFEIKVNDGRTIAIVNHPTPDGGWVATHEDITPFVLLRNERDRSLSLIAAIVENIPMIIFVKDATDFRYLLFNRAGAVAHRISHDQVIGTDANGLFSKDAADAILQQERDFMASGDRVSTAEQKMTTRHGDEKLFHVTRVKLKGNGDKIEYILGIVQDFTARLEMLKEQAPPRTARLEKVGH